MSQSYVGQHLLIDYEGCHSEAYHSVDLLQSLFPEIIRKCGGTVVQTVFHAFSPYGITGIVVIAESHVAIHTWPEYQKACVDIFSCGDKLNMKLLAQEIKLLLGADSYSHSLILRG